LYLTLDAWLRILTASMPLKVLIIPDKFKSTLTAQAAAEALARGWRRMRPADSLCLLPMTDGGDGFGEAMSQLFGAKPVTTRTVDAAHRPVAASWWWAPQAKTAIIETARVIGLAMLPRNKFHPFQLDTFGLGAVVRAAAAKGATRCLVGLGGSATNDGGFGVARSLGWSFFDRQGNSIDEWTSLDKLEHIRAPRRTHWIRNLSVAVDVENPLLGPRGATRIYGPQKGLRPRDYVLAERCLGRLALVVRKQFGGEFARMPGAGAAGGLGFGLLAFAGARLEPGFALFARRAGLERRLRWADVVVTGEGKIDESTHMGKGAGQVAQLSRRAKIPCIALAGRTADKSEVRVAFSQVHALTDLTTIKGAEARAAFWLEELAAKAAGQWRGAGNSG
jgi:glycerate kinase